MFAKTIKVKVFAYMKKFLCLSFDDGPNYDPADSTMSDMLDILEENNVPASFFLIGNKITESNKIVISRAIKLGCDIENHSWTHPKMAELSKEEIALEYEKCDNAIFELTGKKAQFFRPPYISVGRQMYDVIKVPFICGLGCNDWDSNYDEEYRYNQMMNDARNGTIFLLHVMEGNSPTLRAVKRIIPELKNQGYTFVNLPDLFKNCNVNPDIQCSLWSVADKDYNNIWNND